MGVEAVGEGFRCRPEVVRWTIMWFSLDRFGMTPLDYLRLGFRDLLAGFWGEDREEG